MTEFGIWYSTVLVCNVIHDFIATIAISVDSELRALPATSEYNSSALKPFSSNSFLIESLL